MSLSETLEHSLKLAPDKPGCYLWIGQGRESARQTDEIHLNLHDNENILYVGKASSIRNRIRQYLKSDDYKTRFLMSKVQRVDWLVTNNEMEALILENNLIKKYSPPYNIRLKDDKTYPYLCLTLSEKFPRLILTRKKTSAENLYFGPYTNAGAARSAMDMIHSLFPIRKRPLKLPLTKPARPCLNFHIGNCLAPCTGNVSEEQYSEIVTPVRQFLEGDTQTVRNILQDLMQKYANKREYEKAARIRNILSDIASLSVEQNVELSQLSENADIIAVYTTDKTSLDKTLGIENEDSIISGVAGQIVLLRVRNSRLLSKQSYSLTEDFESSRILSSFSFLESFFRDYYLKLKDIPALIITDIKSAETHSWEKLLSLESGHTVKIISGKGSANNHNFSGLLQMAETNARLTLRERVLSEKMRNEKLALRQLQKFVNLPELPVVIECYDISNIQGTEPVASGVMFREGIPYKAGYRKYKIQTVHQANDPAMIHEVISRRLAKVARNEIKKPDLIVIDGGTTQLRAAMRAREETGVQVPMIGLAKQREEIYTEDGRILQFDKDSPGMLLLRRTRDEAHRFAVSYHRDLRAKRNLKSILDDIEGIADKRRAMIMNLLRKTDLSVLKEDEILPLLKTIKGLPGETAGKIAEKIKDLISGS